MRRSLLHLCLVLGVAGCGGCGDQPAREGSSATQSDTTTEVLAELLPARVPAADLGRGHSVEERMAHLRVPGFGMALIENDRVVSETGQGRFGFDDERAVTTETAFQAASLSKAVTAFGVLVLAQRGVLDLDAPVNSYLSNWKIPDDERGQAGAVTMAHLLSHTAALTVGGFPGYSPGAPLPTLVEVLDGAAPANTAPVRIEGTVGEGFSYSGGGYTVAQLVMEQVTGESFPQLMRELVLEPLGMTHSSFEQPAPDEVAGRAAPAVDGRGARYEDAWHVYPEQAAAGLWTTAGDYARFVVGVAAALHSSRDALISRELARRMTTPVKDGYGLGLGIHGEGDSVVIRHGGSNHGYKCAFVYSPVRRAGVVIMTAADNGITLASEIFASVERRLDFGHPVQESVSVEPLPDDYAALAGEWRVDAYDITFVIYVEDGKLWIEDEHTAPWQLHHLGNDTYRTMEESARFTANRAEDGSVESLTLAVNGETAAVYRADAAQAA